MISVQNVFHAYINLGSRIWQQLPVGARNSSIAAIYGRHLHALVCRYAKRTQNHSTFFMRNRPEMELLRRVIHQRPQGAKLAIMVLACSKGAEVYSIVWTIRSARPDLKLHLTAIDISQEITDFAKNGTYALEQSTERLQQPSTDLTGRERLIWNTYREQGPLHNISLFERLSPSEIEGIFDINDDTATVKGWLKEDVTWAVGDAGDPSLVHSHGPQDIVVANRFLCHMEPQMAERCLRNIGGMVKLGGYLFVSGVDLDVRANVARDLGWVPVPELIQEIHEGDPSLTNGWPLGWWGVEPFSTNRRGWQYRYACVYRLPDTQGPSTNPNQRPKTGAPVSR